MAESERARVVQLIVDQHPGLKLSPDGLAVEIDWRHPAWLAGPEYPHADGDVTVLGPEAFVSSDGSVISFRGENYYRDADCAVGEMAVRLLAEATDDLLDDRAITEYLDRDDLLADQGLRTLFSPEGRVALRAAIVRRCDGG